MGAAPLPLDSDPTNGLPPEFIGGFVTLMGHERELRALVRRAVTQVRGRQAPNLIRILRHHDDQIGAIIGLVERRQDELPEAVRVQALQASVASQTHAPPPPEGARFGTLRQFVAFHFGLVHEIEALIKSGNRRPGGEPLLAEAAQHHEDMAWMLRALLNEEEHELLPSELSSAGMSRPESRWENEGGACLSDDEAERPAHSRPY